MTIELDVDDATEERLEELANKSQEDPYLELAFAVEDMVQGKYQQMRKAEKQQEEARAQMEAQFESSPETVTE